MRIALTLVASQHHELSTEVLGAAMDAIGQRSDPTWIEPDLACDFYIDSPVHETMAGLRRDLSQALAGFAVVTSVLGTGPE